MPKLFVSNNERWKCSAVYLADWDKDSGFERPSTPNSGSSSPANEPPEFISQPRNQTDDENDGYDQSKDENVQRKKGGYDSRIEQILCEDQDLQIIIIDAGKTQESGGSFISYTIRTGVRPIQSRWPTCSR